MLLPPCWTHAFWECTGQKWCLISAPRLSIAELRLRFVCFREKFSIIFSFFRALCPILPICNTLAIYGPHLAEEVPNKSKQLPSSFRVFIIKQLIEYFNFTQPSKTLVANDKWFQMTVTLTNWTFDQFLFHSSCSIHLKRIDHAKASLKNFICGSCAVGFDTQADMQHHKRQAEHVSVHDIVCRV